MGKESQLFEALSRNPADEYTQADAARKRRQVLEPGDIINTGTPQGVALSGKFPYLREGDRMEISIEKLGRQEQKLVSYTKQ